MKKILTLTFLLFPMTLQATELTLEDVVEFVKKNHPVVDAAKQGAKEARAAKGAESWLPDPMVGLEFEEIPLSNPSLGNSLMTDYFISQEIPFPGTLAVKSSALESEYKAAQSMVTGAVWMAIFDAKQTFLKLVAVENQIKNKKGVLNSFSQLVASLSQEYETNLPMGEESLFSDLMMAKMKKAEVEAEIFDLNHKKETLRSRLNLLLGRASMDPLPALEIPKLEGLTIDEKTLEEKFVGQNPDLKALEWMVNKAKKEKTLATMGLIPTLKPEFTYQRRQNMDNAYTLSIGLNFPLWFNRNKAEIDRAQAAHLRAKAELENKTLDLKTMFHNLLHHAVEHNKIVKKYESEIVPFARSAFKAAETAYEANQISSASLLQRLTNYYEASKMYWEMWEDYQVDYAMLEQVVGEEL